MSRQIRFNGAAGGLRDGEFYLDDDSLTNPESHCMTTMNTPHRVVRAASGDDVENEIYFIAQLPLGSYVVHCWSSNDASGYCGSELTFLTEDGSFETVKGPYEMSFGWRDYNKLVTLIQLPQLYNVVCKIAVGTAQQVGYDLNLVDIVYEEPSMAQGSILPIIRSERNSLHVRVKQVNAGERTTSVANLLKWGEDRFFDIRRD